MYIGYVRYLSQLKFWVFCFPDISEIAVLPHLVSSGILKFKLQIYILKPQTKDQRLARLIEALSTRGNGLGELVTALEKSKNLMFLQS